MNIKISITIKGLDVTLTEDEARELHAALDRVVGTPRTPVIPIVQPAPNVYPWPGFHVSDVWCGVPVSIISATAENTAAN